MLIDRDKAILKCQERLYESALNNVEVECKADEVFSDIAQNRIKDWLEELPSAERKGYWKPYNEGQEGWQRTDGTPIFMSCSLCNGTVVNNFSAHWNYCPNCGAHMRGETE